MADDGLRLIRPTRLHGHDQYKFIHRITATDGLPASAHPTISYIKDLTLELCSNSRITAYKHSGEALSVSK